MSAPRVSTRPRRSPRPRRCWSSARSERIIAGDGGANMVADGVTLEGGCLCGAIRYTLTGPSLFVSQCACKDCQKATGTGHTTIVGIHNSQLDLTGTPATYTNEGDTGGSVTRHFCGTCGG